MSYPSLNDDERNQFDSNGWKFEKIILNNLNYIKVIETSPNFDIKFFLENLTKHGYQPVFYPPDLILVNKFDNIENYIGFSLPEIIQVNKIDKSSIDSDINYIHDDNLNISVNKNKNKNKNKFSLIGLIIGLSIALAITIWIIIMFLLDII